MVRIGAWHPIGRVEIARSGVSNVAGGRGGGGVCGWGGFLVGSCMWRVVRHGRARLVLGVLENRVDLGMPELHLPWPFIGRLIGGVRLAWD